MIAFITTKCMDFRDSAPEREAPISPFAGPDHHWQLLCPFRVDVRPLPHHHLPLTRNARRTPGISSATSPALLVSSVGKCYCNTCSSRHIPLALTLQPLAKLGHAIRRDKDSTVPGPRRCASLFSDGVICHVGGKLINDPSSDGFSHADGCAGTLLLAVAIAFGNVTCPFEPRRHPMRDGN